MNASENDQGLNVRNLSLDSESQYSIFFTSYNLYSLNTSVSNGTSFASLTNSETLVKFLIQGVGLSLITGLGIVGNICSVIVLCTPRMRSSISCFLIGLAISDIMILITSLILMGLPIVISFEPLYPGLTSVYLMIGYITPFAYSLSVTGITASVYFTVAVTLERYLVVCHPFLSRRICTWRRACQASTIIFLFAIVYNLPRWFHFTCETVYDDHGESIGCFVKATTWRKNPTYHYYYIFVIYGIVHYFIPGIVLIVFNLLIYLKIREANQNRRALSVSDAKENSLAYMLFVVVAVFIACNGLLGVGIVYKLFTWDTPLKPNAIMSAVGIFLVILNSSLNFVIYCTYGLKFREVFFDLMSKPWGRLTRSRQLSDSNISTGSKCCVIKTQNAVKIQSIKTICDSV